MNYILLGLLALSQIIIFPNLSYRWAKEVSAQIVIILFIGSLVWKKNKWVALFILWSMVLFFLGKGYVINDCNSNIQYKINIIAFLNMVNIVLYGLFYYVLHQIKLDKKLVYKTLCFIGIFQAVYVIFQYLQLDQFFFSAAKYQGFGDKINWPTGTMANEALVSWLIVLCSPFFLAFKELRFKIGYGVCFIALLCTKVSTGIIGFVLGFLFWLWFKNRRLAIQLISCILLIVIGLYFSGKLDYYLQDTHRFKVWKKAVEIWRPASIMGQGVGSFRTLFWERAPEFRTDGHWAQAHNEYLQVLFEHGIIGFGIILGLMWTTFLKFFRKRKGLVPITSLFILSVIAITSFPLRTAMGIIPIFALVLAEKDLED